MRSFHMLFVPASLAFLAAAPAAIAQTQAERQMFEPMFDLALQKLNDEQEALDQVEMQLQGETDLVRGCGLLDRSLAHLRRSDELLSELEGYADRLRRRSQLEAVQAQQTTTRQTIALREGDIQRMCRELPES